MGHTRQTSLVELRQTYRAAPHCRAVCNSQSRYSVSGVTPVMPPQPALPFGPVDQLTTPTMTGPPGLSSNTGPPESPVQAPSPSRVPWPIGSTRRICSVPGLPVATRLGDANGAAALAVAADGDADAGNGEAAADVDRNIWHAKDGRRFALGGRVQLQQRDIGGGAVRQHRIHLEAGMDRDAADDLQRGLARAVVDDAVVRAGLHAMRRGEHDFRRNQTAGAEIAARADDGDDRTRHALRRCRAAADDGVR